MWWNGTDSAALDAALALYRASFDRSAIPDERVRALLANGTYRLALDGARAMALVAWFPTERFAHLDYIATASADRRQGIASRLVEFLLAEARAAGCAAFTLETQDEMASFYGARGAKHLAGLGYLFPSPSHGPMPMHVMAWPLDGATSLSRTRAATIVTGLYRVIHARPAPDPILEGILAGIPEPVLLEPRT